MFEYPASIQCLYVYDVNGIGYRISVSDSLVLLTPLYYSHSDFYLSHTMAQSLVSAQSSWSFKILPALLFFFGRVLSTDAAHAIGEALVPLDNVDVFILSETGTDAASVGRALKTLGYQEQQSRVFAHMHSDQFSVDVLRRFPEAKFINPRGKGHEQDSEARYADAIALAEQEERLLALGVEEADDVVSEKWVQLSQFLGMGYSTVERLRLRQFPSG